MRADVVDVSLAVIAERAAKGLDKLDERWEGKWRLVNPPKLWHGRLSADLFYVLFPLAKRGGLEAYGDGTGVFGGVDDWRVPDQAYALRAHAMEDGLSSAELVVEVRSPRDDTYEKLSFYGQRGVREVLIIHRDRHFELRRLDESGEYELVEDEDGSAVSDVLGVRFAVVDGPRLRITWDDGSADV